MSLPRAPLEDLSARELAIVCRSWGLTAHADYLEAALADLEAPGWLRMPWALRSVASMAADPTSTIEDLEAAMEAARKAVAAAASQPDDSAIGRLRRVLLEWPGEWPPGQAAIGNKVGWKDARSVRQACERAGTTWKREMATATAARNGADSAPIPGPDLAS